MSYHKYCAQQLIVFMAVIALRSQYLPRPWVIFVVNKIWEIGIHRRQKDKKSRGGKGWALFLNELLSLHNNMTILQSHSVAASFSYFAVGWDLFIATGGLFFPPQLFLM